MRRDLQKHRYEGDDTGSESRSGNRSADAADRSSTEVRADGRSDETLRVATYNIRYAGIDDEQFAWERRRDGVVTAINQVNPDILALQEVWLEQLPDLQRRLDYSWVAHPDTSGPHTPIAYRSERLTMTAGGSFGLAPGGERGVIAWDAQFQRTVTHATFRDRQTDDTFTVFSVHLDHDGSTAREKSAQLLTGRIPANPCVFAGDYNCVPESDPYKQLTVPLTDTRKAAIHRDGPQETYVGFDTADDSGPEGGKQQSRVGNDADSRQLDYLFTRGFSVVRHRVNVPDGLSSDHRPVMVDLIVE